MAAQNSAGIQTLLDAEREAQRIIQKEIARLTDTQHESVRNQPILSGMQYLTREDRTKKVKDAKSEAQSEIEEYKKQKDDEFKAYEEKQTSGNKKAEEDADKDAQKRLQEIKKIGRESGSKVVDDILNAVVNVDPQPPKNIE